ncbi:hypothetical protein Taro_038015 [Colocasia esculenta]|uniref:Uncharacterized protein n=1 Tax=Colocasia esculenta TaxID=4460 RepID=A0A843WME1_COLES|nr:hypothetical protein [Colocasia esculenta]
MASFSPTSRQEPKGPTKGRRRRSSKARVKVQGLLQSSGLR